MDVEISFRPMALIIGAFFSNILPRCVKVSDLVRCQSPYPYRHFLGENGHCKLSNGGLPYLRLPNTMGSIGRAKFL